MSYAISIENLNDFSRDVGRTRFFSKITAFFSAKWWIDFFGRKLLSEVVELESEIVKIHSEVFEDVSALKSFGRKEYRQFQSGIDHLTKLYYALEKDQFFERPQIGKKLIRILDLAHELEAEFKVALSQELPREKDDPNLVSAINNTSQNAISSRLNN